MSANPQPLIATIYNPHNQSKEALIAGFIARKQKFERLFKDIRDAPMTKPEQHYLIQGIRGMGKTTLLLRIAYEIDNTPELRQRLIPIVFNEEEYGIGSLADVWERTAKYLGEADASFADLYDTITQQYGQEDYERQALQTLIVALQQQNKKLLLLIDNIGDVLKKLDTQEEKRLREVLLTTPELRLIGATSVAIEQVHDYTKPFYEFFKVIHLEGLSRQEAIDLFLKLGETYHTNAVQQLIERQPGRIEAIRRLTGGVIRTMVLLFEILVENDSGSIFRDLEVLLDRVTPLYKHRMDDLSAQQQKIVDALAQAWDAASAKEVAQTVRLESKVVSAQLNQLINNGIVEKIETNTKNHLYRLEERFFNIWYLMRFGRKTDQRVLWLTRFFETMFAGNTEWMHERIDGHLQAIEIGKLDPEAALYLTTVFSNLVKDEGIEDKLKRMTRIYLIKLGRIELAEEINISKYEKVTDLMNDNKYQEAIDILQKFHSKTENVLLDLLACYTMLRDEPEAVKSLSKLLKLTGAFQIIETDKNIKNISNNEVLEEDSNTFRRVLLSKQEFKKRKPIMTIGTFSFLYLTNDNIFPFKMTYSESIAEISARYFINKNSDRKKIIERFFEDYEQTDYEFKKYGQKINLLNKLLMLWCDRFDKSGYEIVNLFVSSPLVDPWDNHAASILNNQKQYMSQLGQTYLKLLLAKKQYHTAYNYFQQEEWQLKDRFKPLYYATLYFLQDEYPTEYLRMGPELKETVDDVLTEVAQMAIDYV